MSTNLNNFDIGNMIVVSLDIHGQEQYCSSNKLVDFFKMHYLSIKNIELIKFKSITLLYVNVCNVNASIIIIIFN